KFRVDVEVSGQKAEIEKLEIPVWSEANGQDDIIWYVAETEDGTHYSQTVSVKNHKGDIGAYRYAAYATL
ncbi:GBS Bsp-like repeat-containing protein, partial [[Clostridium] spiroforme]|nr:GBS Bsp-like repeat-containing protein [Thomasclavelia spiroformis]